MKNLYDTESSVFIKLASNATVLPASLFNKSETRSVFVMEGEAKDYLIRCGNNLRNALCIQKGYLKDE